jgi:protoheme IX farnesyltransferase
MERLESVSESRGLPGRPSLAELLLVLFKVRIVALLLFAAIGGAFVAAGGWPGAGSLAVLIACGGLAAAGASALNVWLEREPDQVMARTRHRRRLARAGWVPPVATAMIVVPVLAVLPFNPALAFWLLAGAAIYVGVYTAWLKPRTVLNIVLGGTAGSAAVLSGAAAAGAWQAPAALILALLVLAWTPTHFWSLVIVHQADYARARSPMLPVRTTPRAAATWIALHTAVTALAALALGVALTGGWLYFVPVGLVTLELLRRSVCLVVQPTPARARALFIGSNIYLAIVILTAMIEALVN